MLTTGYHGTTQKAAESILQDKCFKKSSGHKEWLGTGIYFYKNFADAYNWNPQNSEEPREVLHAVIKVPDEAYLDLDEPAGKRIYQKIVQFVAEQAQALISLSAQQNQCAVANLIWQEYPECEMLAMSFPSEPSKMPLLKDARPLRKEFCVRDNSCIKCIQIIEYRGDDDDK